MRRCCHYRSTSETTSLVKRCVGYSVQLANKSYVANESVVFKFIVIDKAEEVRRWSTSRPLIEITLFPLTTTFTFRTYDVPLPIASDSKPLIGPLFILALYIYQPIELPASASVWPTF